VCRAKGLKGCYTAAIAGRAQLADELALIGSNIEDKVNALLIKNRP
jgi:hypothetical protein